MNSIDKRIHEYVEREREKGKTYHYRKPDSYSYTIKNKEEYSYFHIIQDPGIKMLLFGEITIYHDCFSTVAIEPYVDVISKRIKMDSTIVKKGAIYNDLVYLNFYDTPENLVSMLETIVETMRTLNSEIELIKKLE